MYNGADPRPQINSESVFKERSRHVIDPRSFGRPPPPPSRSFYCFSCHTFPYRTRGNGWKCMLRKNSGFGCNSGNCTIISPSCLNEGGNTCAAVVLHSQMKTALAIFHFPRLGQAKFIPVTSIQCYFASGAVQFKGTRPAVTKWQNMLQNLLLHRQLPVGSHASFESWWKWDRTLQSFWSIPHQATGTFLHIIS